jgi:predicted permease
VLLVPTDLHRIATKPEQAASLYERMLERLRVMPGIDAASVEEMPMLGGWTASTHYASVLPNGAVREDQDLYFNNVGANYFTTTGTRILAGRDFTEQDRDSKHIVCALNRSAAQFFFPQGNAIGSSVRDYSENKPGSPCEIVAVVEDTKFTSLKQAPPHVIYVTFMEAPGFGIDVGRFYLVLRTNNPASAAASARQVLRELAPGAPQLVPVTMDEQLLDSIGRERAMAMLAGSFAALALLLTALGLYGTLSYQVNRRTREIAIRMAVGAEAGDVVRMVVRRAMLLTIIGLIAGLCAAGLAAPLVKSMLFGVRPLNPIALIAAAVLLIAIAAVASFWPARRATKVDPMLALRAE